MCFISYLIQCKINATCRNQNSLKFSNRAKIKYSFNLRVKYFQNPEFKGRTFFLLKENGIKNKTFNMLLLWITTLIFSAAKQNASKKLNSFRNLKIFKTLSIFLNSRTPRQCRSHFQKLMNRFKSFKKVIFYYQNLLGL